MPIRRTFGPRFADVGAYARAGAAGVAGREDMWRGAQMGQQYDLQQQSMGLRREENYQAAVARMADMRMRAYQWNAEQEARKAESEADRTHAREMQQSGFENTSALAEANDTRGFENQKAFADHQLNNRKLEYEYETSAQTEAKNNEINRGLSYVREQRAGGRMSEEEAMNWEMELEAQRAGLTKSPVVKKKQPTVMDELTSRQHADEKGVYLMQPDGRIDFRPHKAEKPMLTPESFVSMRSEIAERLKTFIKDGEGKDIGEKPASAEAIDAEMESVLKSYDRFMSRQEQAAPPQSAAPSMPTGQSVSAAKPLPVIQSNDEAAFDCMVGTWKK